MSDRKIDIIRNITDSRHLEVRDKKRASPITEWEIVANNIASLSTQPELAPGKKSWHSIHAGTSKFITIFASPLVSVVTDGEGGREAWNGNINFSFSEIFFTSANNNSGKYHRKSFSIWEMAKIQFSFIDWLNQKIICANRNRNASGV